MVVDTPFGFSYQADPFDGVRNVIRIMKKTGADALKLEGGEEVIETITKIIGAGDRRRTSGTDATIYQ